jgi:hypothetical protein
MTCVKEKATKNNKNEDKDLEVKKIIEPDIPLSLLDEDKEDKVIDEESPITETEDEEADEAVTLDDEELNPFDDKWEQ